MLKINERFVARLKLSRVAKPHPFPGRFPTRLAVTWTDAKGPQSYVGKPFPALLARLAAHNIVTVKEFDRHSLLLSTGLHEEPVLNKRLFVTYHPGTTDLDSHQTEATWIGSFAHTDLAGKFRFYYVLGQNVDALRAKVLGLLADRPGRELAERLAKQTAARKRPFNPYPEANW